MSPQRSETLNAVKEAVKILELGKPVATYRPSKTESWQRGGANALAAYKTRSDEVVLVACLERPPGKLEKRACIIYPDSMIDQVETALREASKKIRRSR